MTGSGAPTGCGGHLGAQVVEVLGSGSRSRFGGGAGEQQVAQVLAVLVAADQVADVFTGRAVAALGDLVLHERAKGLGQGDVHGRHVLNLPMALANPCQSRRTGGSTAGTASMDTV
jgi:hypothetical protein